jgi:hypothetical protein
MIKVNTLFVIVLCLSSVWPPPTQPPQTNRLPTMQYYITNDYVIVIHHPSTSPVVWEYVDDQWISRVNREAVPIIEYNGRLYSHRYQVDVVSQRDFLMRIIYRWGTKYNYYDFAMLSYHWNGDGRFTLESAADILSGVWLRNDYAN